MTAKQEVLKFFSDAKCRRHRLIYGGKLTIWYVVSAELKDRCYHELSASSKDAATAWKIAVPAAHEYLENMLLRELES